MSRGDSGITALSLRRLELYKSLQDIYNGNTFLGIADNAASATRLQTARTIDGVSFNGTADITLPTKITRLWYDDVDESGVITRHWYSDSTLTTEVTTFDTDKLYINMTDNNFMYYDGSDFITGTAPKLTTSRLLNGMSFDGSADVNDYCVCATAGNEVAKTATLTGFNKVAGASFKIKFDYTTSVDNATLNINNTGAAPVYFNTVPVQTGDLVANIIYHMFYDGTKYIIAGTSKIAYSEFVPSTSLSAGVHGLVPAPGVGDDEEMYLMADCTWRIPSNYHKTSHIYEYGEIVHVSQFPSNYSLQCVVPGTTASTRAAIDDYLNPNS